MGDAGRTDAEFIDSVAYALSSLPTVQAVALGGSRARETHRADSDWDLAVYYRGAFEPRTLRDLGWPGEVSEIGGWGGGVFNGGAWLTIDGRQVDVHYRDLDSVEHEIAEAQAGRFRIEPLMFHVAGIPSYLVVGELAMNRVLWGSLPRPDYPAALRMAAADVWRGRAEANLDYARDAHGRAGRVAPFAGLLVFAALQFGHAILAARGEWPTNEKTLLERAGLKDVDDVMPSLNAEPAALIRAADTVLTLAHVQLGRP